MATLNQLGARVANLLKQPFNLELQERIKDAFKNLRATRIRQSIERNGVDDILTQSYIVCVTKVDVTLDDCARKLGCNILRSSNKVAVPIRYKTDEPFTFVGTDDGVTFIYSTLGAVLKMKYLPMIGNAIWYIYENGYIYLYGNTRIKEFRVQAIFSNPEQVINCCDSSCYSDDMEFPLPEEMIESIIQELLQKEFMPSQPVSDEIRPNSPAQNEEH